MQSPKGGFTIFRNEIWRGAECFDNMAPGLDCVVGDRAKGAAVLFCWSPAPISLCLSAVKAMISLTGGTDTFPKHCGSWPLAQGLKPRSESTGTGSPSCPSLHVVLTSHQRLLHCTAHGGEIKDLMSPGPCASFSSGTAKPVDCIEMSKSRERAWSRKAKEQKAQLGLGDSTPRPYLQTKIYLTFTIVSY